MAKQQTEKVEHRPMPEDARDLARAMFRAADKKIKKGTAMVKKPAARKR